MIMPTTYLADEVAIQQPKQEIINAVNKQVKKQHIPHKYHVGDKILMRKQIDKLGKLRCPTQGLVTIVKVKDLPFNGIVVIDKGSFKEKLNIRRIPPFFPQST
jgi:hypothetical protein